MFITDYIIYEKPKEVIMTKFATSRHLFVTAFISIFVFAIQPAKASTVTFDGSGLTEGTTVTNQFVGVTISGALLAEPATPWLLSQV